MAPLTAARLVHFDEKCGNGSISKGEKCTKGQGTYAKGSGTMGNGTGRPGDPNYGNFKDRIVKNAIPAALVMGALGAAYGGLKTGRMMHAKAGVPGAVVGGLAGAGLGGALNGAAWGAAGAGVGATQAATERLITKVENKAYRNRDNKALKAGAMKALSMRNKSNFDPIAEAKAKEKQINKR